MIDNLKNKRTSRSSSGLRVRCQVNLYSANNFCPENVVWFFMSAAYIQVHFRLDFFMKANNMNPDLGPYCLQYRVSKNISSQEEQTTHVLMAG